jgi:type II secretory pathway component PulF
MMQKDKKGQGFNLLMGSIVAFVVVAVMLVVGINIVTTLGTGYAANSAAANATNATLNAFNTFTSYFSILAIVIIAAVILYFLLRNLGGVAGGSQ